MKHRVNSIKIAEKDSMTESVPDEEPLAMGYIHTHTIADVKTIKMMHGIGGINMNKVIENKIDNTVLNVAAKIAEKKDIEQKIYTMHMEIKKKSEVVAQYVNKNTKLNDTLHELKQMRLALVKNGLEINENITLQKDFASNKILEANSKILQEEKRLNSLSQSTLNLEQKITSNRAYFENMMGKLKDEQIVLIKAFSEAITLMKEKEKHLIGLNKVERNRSKSISNKNKVLSKLIKQEETRNVARDINKSANKTFTSPDRNVIKQFLYATSNSKHHQIS